MRVAIDIGGTFTDVLLYEEQNGDLWSAKVPSDPVHPERPFIEGLKRVLERAMITLEQVTGLIHGTTIVTNALLEGTTSKVGLLVTQGFRDLLEIGRQQRPDLYNLTEKRRPPLVPRERVREVQERVSAEGEILIPLSEGNAIAQIKKLSKSSIDSLAVALLFSFQNPKHEKQIGKIARQILDEKLIFLSSEISPEFREFERASTAAVAAAVAPKVVSYLQAIEQDLKKEGWTHTNLSIMHSGGGTLQAPEASKKPHSLIESGPAAGLIGTGQLANALNLDRVIALDMGGTTAKTGLILNGQPQYTTEYEVGGELHHGGRVKGKGYPVRTPMIDVAECGAGAGSIAWIDAGDHLKVGPQSAGADPGPACYDKGGSQPTVTDAHLVLGRLSSSSFLGGELQLTPSLAATAIKRHIGHPLAMQLEEAAKGIIVLANASMLRILRLISIARGYDPRDFTLVAYGGAGPLHATGLAEEMSIRQVIVPKLPGLFSALGLLYADMSADFVETVMTTLENLDALNEVLARLRCKVEAWFENNKVLLAARKIQASGDVRYLGQNYELNLPLPGLRLSLDDIASIQAHFHRLHTAEYGYSASEEPIQIVNVRLRAIEKVKKPTWLPLKPASSPLESALQGTRSVWFPKGKMRCPVYERSALQAGHMMGGPAIIQEREATTVLRPHWHLEVDAFGNLIISK